MLTFLTRSGSRGYNEQGQSEMKSRDLVMKLEGLAERGMSEMEAKDLGNAGARFSS